jgi:hypothetical protein
MAEFLSNLRSDDIVVVVLFLLCFLAGMIVWISLQWRLHRRTEMEVILKQDMLNRGMSADDIDRVLRASMTPGEPRQPERPAAKPQEPEKEPARPWWAFLEWLDAHKHTHEPEKPRRRRWWCHKG